jgi:hypothetical protein
MDPSAVSAEMRMNGLSLAGAAMRDVCDFLQRQDDAGDALSQLINALLAKNCACACFVRRSLRSAEPRPVAFSAAAQWRQALWTPPPCAMWCRS